MGQNPRSGTQNSHFLFVAFRNCEITSSLEKKENFFEPNILKSDTNGFIFQVKTEKIKTYQKIKINFPEANIQVCLPKSSPNNAFLLYFCCIFCRSKSAKNVGLSIKQKYQNWLLARARNLKLFGFCGNVGCDRY